ncbi:hypothetical protein V511_06905 [Mesotoga sp. Brook.08.YT.4.2.5.1]|jgi:hypothetical protein|uniref:Uncharacterized protein n=1 Tax=Mesotoga prima TaxID=1184387 RepID=A0A117M2N8_9BACT|nr:MULTISPECIES: hypothetical protein [unclassified Mesotoga]KUK81037.1 MAG: Uncharacterized protein XD94_0641 [Mesotoga prima]RAM58980.1 hypothetical protein DS65_02035 [Mesotoga sp. SC_4PWL113PWK15]PNE22675.1 hypothetical protein V511_06905 [Mesotoga sp. Brook.08.YT.4.2.5.1]PNS42355.1 hypothetical protein RJ60_01495 [Mesotoga sp. B105.6.4]PVD17717.1 hypothetical protein V512_012540 [Mesotoga sp. Brook.08.105.5.1]
MGKRARLNSQVASVVLLIISLFLFVESLYIFRYIRESQSTEFEVGFFDLSSRLRILLGDEGYVLEPGEHLVLKIRRNDKLVVEQDLPGRYTVRGGGEMVNVSIPLAEVSVK